MMPVSGHHWDHDNGYSAGAPTGNGLGFRERDRERDLEDYIRKENKVAALLNGAIMPPARYAQVHPMRSEDGTFPADFKSAKTVGVMKTLDNSQLDRIMQSYRIPTDLPPINSAGHHAREATGEEDAILAKGTAAHEHSSPPKSIKAANFGTEQDVLRSRVRDRVTLRWIAL
ncbi:MAG: hypothetical protein L6R41_004459 [Letrouitia leprolyta]|nr:MAG: hypothetical protein L6R41_004459 [Letrouitia leprolyta]